MRKTIGILAHVDAGKTTLSEQILFHAHAIRTRGRVDHQDAFLDVDGIEKRRGITIFSNQAVFTRSGSTFYWVDTPGHVDFSAEMERAAGIMDAAVLVVSSVEGIQGHTASVWKLLLEHRVPTVLFLNKTDRAGADPTRVLRDLQTRFSAEIIPFTPLDEPEGMTQALAESIAERDEQLFNLYLKDGYHADVWLQTARKMFFEGRLFPCFSGSALNDEGVREFLDWLCALTAWEAHAEPEGAPFAGQVYKIRHDRQGSRLTFLKVLRGGLSVKDTLRVCGRDGGETMEKVNEIRIYNGAQYTQTDKVQAGDLCAVTGLSHPLPGDFIGENLSRGSFTCQPALTARVLFPDSVPARTVLGYFRILEDEDPMLHVGFEEALSQITIQVMGEIQLEVLAEVVRERFGLPVSFGECEILYKETIAAPVVGYGHFEPLRHYAEAHLLLEPAPRASGISFASACPTDLLDRQYQNLIGTHVLEKAHKGVLTGSALTDVKITLLTGRAHLKHTEGGDFRQAVYRAIRQGLMHAQSLLLEPYYAFRIEAESGHAGRILSDIQQLHGSFDPPQILGERAVISGRAPASTMMGYSRTFRAFTRGKGVLNLSFDGYEPCHNQDAVISAIGYDCLGDTENTPDSVFCAKGAGYLVKWDEVEKHVHCDKVYPE